MNESMLRNLIRELIDELSSTDGGGSYDTPNAFAANAKDRKRRKKEIEKSSTGYDAIPDEDQDEPDKRVYESYYDWRNDESQSPRAKIATAISSANKSLTEIERLVRYSLKLKTELSLDSKNYWKRTSNSIQKLENRILKLQGKIKQLR